jgi:hypothetical protein
LIPILIYGVELAIEGYEIYQVYRVATTTMTAVNLLSEAAGKNGAKPKDKEATPVAKDETATPLKTPEKAIDEKAKPQVSPEVADVLEKMESITLPQTKKDTKPQQKTTEDLNRTAQDVISKERQGGINREFPEQYRNKTLAEIQKDAKAGNRAAKTAEKLLKDGRFKKNK